MKPAPEPMFAISRESRSRPRDPHPFLRQCDISRFSTAPCSTMDSVAFLPTRRILRRRRYRQDRYHDMNNVWHPFCDPAHFLVVRRSADAWRPTILRTRGMGAPLPWIQRPFDSAALRACPERRVLNLQRQGDSPTTSGLQVRRRMPVEYWRW